jgi:GNAT superfamily N-acetyltransferase
VNSSSAVQTHRLEWIEAEACADLVAAAPVEFAKDVGLLTDSIGNVRLFGLRAADRVIFNRAIGFDLYEHIDSTLFRAAVNWLREHSASKWAIPLIQPRKLENLDTLLSAENLALSSDSVAKFEYNPSSVPRTIDNAFVIRSTTAAEAENFGKVVTKGFGYDQSYTRWFSALPGRPGWSTYVAYDEHEPVGAGALFVCKDSAWLGLGTTIEAYRRRGVQTALLHHRVKEACARGIKIVTVEAYHNDIGPTLSQSHRNVLRAGFSLAYLRRQYSPK